MINKGRAKVGRIAPNSQLLSILNSNKLRIAIIEGICVIILRQFFDYKPNNSPQWGQMVFNLYLPFSNIILENVVVHWRITISVHSNFSKYLNDSYGYMMSGLSRNLSSLYLIQTITLLPFGSQERQWV